MQQGQAIMLAKIRIALFKTNRQSGNQDPLTRRELRTATIVILSIDPDSRVPPRGSSHGLVVGNEDMFQQEGMDAHGSSAGFSRAVAFHWLAKWGKS
ncbi:MAG: hypothetical protein OEU68_16100 [Nitrospira sp.]|nr:hypothetical protein [Nitrospira sp.]MDH4355228.1 hypothetical protein [Nitrospira sp.]MDH5318539.1 hypothetical protein [Nitrospira sp.]